MKKVVDSNYLQASELEEYLTKASSNCVVLTDYAAMEAYKGNTLKSIFKSMHILCKHSQQVYILKSTMSICGLRSQNQGLIKHFIDKGQSKEFSKYCKNLHKAEKGNKALQDALLAYGKSATEHVDKIYSDASHFIADITELSKDYTKQELRVFRKNEPYTSEMKDKMIKHILELALLCFKNHPKVSKPPISNELPSSFIFRYSLCMYLLVIHWISKGGVEDVNPAKMQNDMIDMNYVAYSTYFDGLLSKDKKALLIYKEALSLLDNVFCA